MRKIMFMILMLLTLILTACEPETYYFNYSDRNNEISSIYFISYNNNGTIETVESNVAFSNYKLENEEVIEELNLELMNQFIYDFGQLEFFLDYDHYNAQFGQGIKIDYDNGDFLIIVESILDSHSEISAVLYNSEGIFISQYGGLSWRPHFVELINEYFSVDFE